MMLMMTNLLSLLFAIEIMFIGNALGSCHDEVRYYIDIYYSIATAYNAVTIVYYMEDT